MESEQVYCDSGGGSMDFTSLRYFMIVSEERNISKAAERLYISRQALSKMIKKMEKTLGYPLVLAKREGIELTPEGEAVFAASKQILSLWDETLASFTPANPAVVTLEAGFGHNSYNVWPADHVRRYIEENPDMRVKLHSLPPDQLLEGLRSGQLDLAVSNIRPAGEEFYYRTLVHRPMYAFLCEQDPLTKKDAVTPQDLHGRAIIFIPYDEIGMVRFSSLMEGYGLSCQAVVSPDSTLTTICSTIELYRGVFITSAIFWETSRIPGFVRIPFDTGVPHSFYNLDINAVIRRKDAGIPGIERYISYLASHVRPEFKEKA